MPASPEPKPWNILKSSGFDLVEAGSKSPVRHSSRAGARAFAAKKNGMIFPIDQLSNPSQPAIIPSNCRHYFEDPTVCQKTSKANFCNTRGRDYS